FSATLKWLPAGGMHSAHGGGFLDYVKHVAMPAFASAFVSIGVTARMTRASLLETYNMDFVDLLHAKGLRSWPVLRHVAKTAASPVLTVAGLQIGFLLGGSVLVETIFSWPGLGQLIFQAIAARDFKVLQAGVLVVAVTFVLMNLLVDVLQLLIDPRLRKAASRSGGRRSAQGAADDHHGPAPSRRPLHGGYGCGCTTLIPGRGAHALLTQSRWHACGQHARPAGRRGDGRAAAEPVRPADGQRYTPPVAHWQRRSSPWHRRAGARHAHASALRRPAVAAHWYAAGHRLDGHWHGHRRHRWLPERTRRRRPDAHNGHALRVPRHHARDRHLGVARTGRDELGARDQHGVHRTDLPCGRGRDAPRHLPRIYRSGPPERGEHGEHPAVTGAPEHF